MTRWTMRDRKTHLGFPRVTCSMYKVLCGASHPNVDQSQIALRRHKEPIELNRLPMGFESEI